MKPRRAGRGEEHALRVGRPVQDDVVGRVGRERPGVAAAGGDDEDVEVAVAVAREGDPLAVGREPRVVVAALVDREPLDVRAVLAGDPDVAQVAERDLARVVVRVADEPGLAAEGRAGQHQRQRDRECVLHRRGSGVGWSRTRRGRGRTVAVRSGELGVGGRGAGPAISAFRHDATAPGAEAGESRQRIGSRGPSQARPGPDPRPVRIRSVSGPRPPGAAGRGPLAGDAVNRHECGCQRGDRPPPDGGGGEIGALWARTGAWGRVGVDPGSGAPTEPGATASEASDSAGSSGVSTLSSATCDSDTHRSAPDFSSAISCWIVARSDRSIAIS